MKLVAGFNKILLEFGLRRAQGPMSGMLASKYSLVGGFNSIN
jgi:nicotinate phosphoribosyltransferase